MVQQKSDSRDVDHIALTRKYESADPGDVADGCSRQAKEVFPGVSSSRPHSLLPIVGHQRPENGLCVCEFLTLAVTSCSSTDGGQRRFGTQRSACGTRKASGTVRVGGVGCLGRGPARCCGSGTRSINHNRLTLLLPIRWPRNAGLQPSGRVSVIKAPWETPQNPPSFPKSTLSTVESVVRFVALGTPFL